REFDHLALVGDGEYLLLERFGQGWGAAASGWAGDVQFDPVVEAVAVFVGAGAGGGVADESEASAVVVGDDGFEVGFLVDRWGGSFFADADPGGEEDVGVAADDADALAGEPFDCHGSVEDGSLGV